MTTYTDSKKRRDVLRAFGLGSIAGVAGCFDESPDSTPTSTPEESSISEESTSSSTHEESTESQESERGLISYNPYEGVDWIDVDHHKSEFHNHVRGSVEEPADIVDLYHNLDYTVFAVADKGYRPMAWPWTEFLEVRDSYTENRDPTEIGVVAFPGCEFTEAEHVGAIFTTLDHEAASNSVTDAIETIADQIDVILSRVDHHIPPGVGGFAVLNHPQRYYDDPDDEWGRYISLFRSYSRQEGFIGLEAFNKEASNNEDIRLWDHLLAEFAPDRLIWGFANDDPGSYTVGKDVDVRWTTVLLGDDQFDPSNQQESRVAAANAFREGRTLLHQREAWDDDDTDPAIPPKVESITVDTKNNEITIEAVEYDSIQWVSNGKVVSTDETIALDSDHKPYIRVHLWNDAGAETSTQPFALEE